CVGTGVDAGKAAPIDHDDRRFRCLLSDETRLGSQQRQANSQLRTATWPVTTRGTPPPVHLGQPSHERQTDAEAALIVSGFRVELRKQLEDLRDLLGRDAYARVFTADSGRRTLRAR